MEIMWLGVNLATECLVVMALFFIRMMALYGIQRVRTELLTDIKLLMAMVFMCGVLITAVMHYSGREMVLNGIR